MLKITQIMAGALLIVSIAYPVQAKSRHQMCEIAEMASDVISQKTGDTIEAIAQKRNAVHNQCFTAPLKEIEAAYSYLIENWDSIFDQSATK